MDDREHRDETPVPPRELQYATVEVIGQPRLYANGRQQVEIEIYVEMAGKENHMSPTQGEMDSIVLLDYDSPQNLISSTTAYKGWRSQDERDPDYDSYPSRSAGPPQKKRTRDAVHARGRKRKFYLSATADALASGRLHIAFRITSDDGVISNSAGYHLRPIGEGKYEEEYDSAIDISGNYVTPERPLSYDRGSFHLDPGDGTLATPHSDEFDVAQLSIVHMNVPVAIRVMICTPPGAAAWFPNDSMNLNPYYTGYLPPGGKEAIWLEAPFSSQLAPPSYDNPSETVGLFLVCRHQGIRNEYPEVKQNIRVTLIDQYGSDQQCTLELQENALGLVVTRSAPGQSMEGETDDE